MTLYLSGAMTGHPDGNRPAFAAAQKQLEAAGYTVVNPHDLDHPPDVTWDAAMARDLAALKLCDGLARMDGSEHSRGSGIEAAQAERDGQRVAPVRNWIEWAQRAHALPERATKEATTE